MFSFWFTYNFCTKLNSPVPDEFIDTKHDTFLHNTIARPRNISPSQSVLHNHLSNNLFIIINHHYDKLFTVIYNVIVFFLLDQARNRIWSLTVRSRIDGTQRLIYLFRIFMMLYIWCPIYDVLYMIAYIWCYKNIIRKIPELISKLIIFVDDFGMMHVKCKISHDAVSNFACKIKCIYYLYKSWSSSKIASCW